jgi:multicomponent Na+:H+ antiporter subunit A
VLTLLLLGALMLIPPALRAMHETDQAPPELFWRNILVSVAIGGAAFAVVWSTFSTPRAESVAAEHIHLTPEAHASDVVTAILADFRGLDTLGEISVIVIALLGIVAVLQQVRSQA